MSADNAQGTLIRDEETLADYVEGRLNSSAAAQVQAWLVEDDAAFDAVVLARSMMDEEAALMGARFPQGSSQAAARERAQSLFRPTLTAAVFRLVQGALDLVDELVSGQWAPVAVPAVRGDGATDGRDLWEGRIPAGDDMLHVEVERTEQGALIAAGVASAEGAQVALLLNGELICLQPATVEPAELAEVGAGRVRLEIRRNGQVVGGAEVALRAA